MPREWQEDKEESPAQERPGSQRSQPRPRGVVDEADTRQGGSPLQEARYQEKAEKLLKSKSKVFQEFSCTREVKRTAKLPRMRLPWSRMIDTLTWRPTLSVL